MNIEKIFTLIGEISTLLGFPIIIYKLIKIFSHPKQKLQYSCKKMTVLKPDYKLLYKNDNTPYTRNYKLILETSYNDYNDELITQQENIDSLCVYNIEIKNTGKKDIKGTDFFKNDKLGLKIKDDIFGIAISSETQKYINARIETFDNECINIEFDTLKRNDSIYISMLAKNSYNFGDNIVIGRTNEISFIGAMDSGTAEQIYNSCVLWRTNLFYIKESFNLLKKSIYFILTMIVGMNIFIIGIINLIYYKFIK